MRKATAYLRTIFGRCFAGLKTLLNKNKYLSWAVTILLPVAVAALFFLIGSHKRETASPLEEKIRRTGTVISMWDKTEGDNGKFSLTRLDSIQTMEKAAAEMKKKVEKEKAGDELALADKETLVKLMPQPKGWISSKVHFSKGGYGGSETANLEANFSGPNSRRIDLELIDYGAAKAALQLLKMNFSMNRNFEDRNRYEKTAVYGNNIKVFEKYDKKRAAAEFSFIIQNRYIVKLRCKGRNSPQVLKGFIEASRLPASK